MSITRNAAKVAISDFQARPSAEIVRVQVVLQDPGNESLKQRSWPRDLHSCISQVLLQDPAEEILTQTLCARDVHTGILHKRSYTTLMQKFRHRDLAQEIRIRRSCTNAPNTGSWRKDPEKETLNKRSTYGDPARVVLRDPDTYIFTEFRKILHKKPTKKIAQGRP